MAFVHSEKQIRVASEREKSSHLAAACPPTRLSDNADMVCPWCVLLNVAEHCLLTTFRNCFLFTEFFVVVVGTQSITQVWFACALATVGVALVSLGGILPPGVDVVKFIAGEPRN